MILSRILRALRRDEGVALPAVIGIGIVISILVLTGAAISTSGAAKSLTDGNSQSAIQAAYAGAADYQSRLTNDNTYWQFGAPTSFTGSSTYLQGTGGNPAFGTAAGGTWATVSGSNGTESYRYEVNNSRFAGTGAVQVRVTGRSGNQTRSLVATVRGTGFIDYLYFTDYESSNPALTGESQAAPNGSLPCISVHMSDPAYDANSACNPVQFAAGDVLGGPIRSNDEFTICGATFNQTVQSTAANGVFNKPTGCANPTFGQASATSPQPAHVGTLLLPQTNSDMIQAARTDTNPIPGCVYTGPTSISFNGDGSMQIISPWSKGTQVIPNADGVSYSGTMGLACGSLTDLKSAAGARVTLSQNLIYVQSVPLNSNDVNYWASGTQPLTPGSGAIVCSTLVSGVTTYGNGLMSPALANGTRYNYPSPTEYVGSVGNLSSSSPYYCRNGDAFVSGQFNGSLTIGAQNNLYVVGAITYKDSTNDILGLVGQKSVAVWNPISCSQLNGDGTCSTSLGKSTLLKYVAGSNISIYAAIASNGGTFTVQNYAYGARLGTLTVSGSIAQEWRGAVGVNFGDHITGVTKSYGYDQRLKNTAPPKFLQPVTTAYSISQQVEVSPAYKSTGGP